MVERNTVSEASVVWRSPLTKEGHAVEIRRHSTPITSTVDAAGEIPSGKLSVLDPTGKVLGEKREPVSLAHALFDVHEEDFEVKEWKRDGLEMLGKLPRSA